jgi:preprotein translocase subunit SecG
MIDILLIVHIIIGALLLISILLQKTSSDSIANLAGNNSGLVSAKTSANFLTKTTIFLTVVFMVNSLVLGNLSTKKPERILEIEKNINQQEPEELPIAQ